MIIIPSSKILDYNLYIGAYCANFCKFKLYAQYKTEFPIYLNQNYEFNLKRDIVMFFNYEHKEDAEHIEIISYTKSYASSYKMLVYLGIYFIYH